MILEEDDFSDVPSGMKWLKITVCEKLNIPLNDRRWVRKWKIHLDGEVEKVPIYEPLFNVRVDKASLIAVELK